MVTRELSRDCIINRAIISTGATVVIGLVAIKAVQS